MRRTRSLLLAKETLAELTAEQLLGVAAAGPETQADVCTSGIIRCTGDIVTEMLSIRSC